MNRDQFMARLRTDEETGCWIYTGPLTQGYGQFVWNGQTWRANRLAYFWFKGEHPGHLHVLHRCDRPACCNPDHLFLGTAGDNARDRDIKGRNVAPNADKPLCVRGHPLAGDNVYLTNLGKRHCRACQQQRNREYKARRRANSRLADGLVLGTRCSQRH